VKNVLVFKIDRLTRSTADLIYLVDLFNEFDCSFNSLMESIDTQTASGRMFLKIVGIFAEFERENLIERIKLGTERKVKEGFSLCKNLVSYGYERPNGEKVQTICKEEAKIVQDVFELYVHQGLSLRMIARKLNLLGVPTKTKTSTWQVKTVRNMLINCNYIGNVRYHIEKGVPEYEGSGVHEAIIPIELYEKAQRMIQKNAIANRTKRPNIENIFSGLLICGICGEKLVSHNIYDKLKNGTTELRIRYRCPMKYLGNCASHEMGIARVNQAFVAYIETIASLDASDLEQVEEQGQKERETEKKRAIYEENLRQLEAKRKEILGKYVENAIAFDDYSDMKKKLTSDKQFLEQELAQLAQAQPDEMSIQKEDIIRDLTENWQYLNDKERRQFLVRFVQKIVVVNEKAPGHKQGIVRVMSVKFQEE
jgi:site-specific DNA recombinase